MHTCNYVLFFFKPPAKRMWIDVDDHVIPRLLMRSKIFTAGSRGALFMLLVLSLAVLLGNVIMLFKEVHK